MINLRLQIDRLERTMKPFDLHPTSFSAAAPFFPLFFVVCFVAIWLMDKFKN